MSNQNQYTSDLFAVIPPALRTHEQVPCWRRLGDIPTYRMLRRPVDLQEFTLYNHIMAFWRENGTLTYVMPQGNLEIPYSGEDILSLYCDNGPSFHIVGRFNDAVVQTAAFLLDLEEPSEETSALRISSCGRACDFRGAQSRSFTRIFKAGKSRTVHLSHLKLSVQQSIVLATQPYPIKLTFWDCEFEDQGKAFINALAKRQSSFGSLTIDNETELYDDDMKRLLQLDTFEHLGLSVVSLKDSEMALLPFSAKVDSLDYEVTSTSLMKANSASLSILAKKLAIAIFIEHSHNNTFPTDPVLSFFRRIADIGHFEELKIRIDSYEEEMDIPECAVQELIRTTLANTNLKVLDLTVWDIALDWAPHLCTLFEGLKDHKGLRTLKVTADEDEFGTDYCHLERFLSCNRYITVKDENGIVFSDGFIITKLYSLNRFYRGLADFAVKSPSERPLLVATTLIHGASNDFQRSSLLLSNYADALHDLIQFEKLDELCDDDSLSHTAPGTRPKRRRRSHRPRAAKR